MDFDFTKITKMIYHKACHDGLACAGIIYKFKPDIEYFPAQYDNELPNYENETILIADYSISKENLLKYMEKNTVYFIDHHLPSLEYKHYFIAPHFYYVNKDNCGAINLWQAVLDAASRLFPKNIFNTKLPIILQYVNDRDLWLNKLPHYQEVFDGLTIQDKTVSNWSKLVYSTDEKLFKSILTKGTIIRNKTNKEISYLATKAYIKKFNYNNKNYNVIYVNSPILQSDLGSYLIQNNDVDFAAIYHYNGKINKTIFSLRGKDKVNLSDIAKSFGGGGHFNAAGCSIFGLNSELV